jgi:CheY-like chemotaxis protein
MDMQMPVRDGSAATRALRESDYSGPILALTANAMEPDRRACLDAGCDAFATKPIDRELLLGHIDRLVRTKCPWRMNAAPQVRKTA